VGGGVAEDEGGGAAAVEIDGGVGAEFLEFGGQFCVGHADGESGLAAVDDEDVEFGAGFVQADGGAGMAGGVGLGDGLSVFEEEDAAAEGLVDVWGEVFFGVDQFEFGVGGGVEQEGGAGGGGFVPEFIVGDGIAGGRRPFLGDVAGFFAFDVFGVQGGEEIAVDGDVVVVALGDLGDGHEGGGPGAGGAIGVVAGAGDAEGDIRIGQVDDENVDREVGVVAELVVVDDGRLGARDGAETESEDGDEATRHGGAL